MDSNTDNLTFVDILRYRAKNTSDKKAFTFINNDGNIELTYSQLDEKIRKIAGKLQELELKDERVLLLYPPGIDYIIGYFACLYAGVIAVPVYPPEPASLKKTLPRLQSILSDSKAKLALSNKEIIDDVKNWEDNLNNEIDDKRNDDILSESGSYAERFKDIFSLEWMSTDNIDEFNENKWKEPEITPKTTAYLQYTSGSTGDPKGVIITHENLVHNTKVIFNGFGLNNKTYEVVIWLPIYHDMGLVGGILEPIFSGFHCTLLSPTDFLKRPSRWLQIISDIKDNNVVSGGPNFAYDLCFRATTPQKREKLDLSNWKLAFSGAEPVRAETIDEFSEAFSVSGFKKNAFYPCYGLAEGTLLVAGGIQEEEPVQLTVDKRLLIKNIIQEVDSSYKEKVDLISSGREIMDGKIRIVNPETKKICKEKEIGEIWSASKSNAKGYWDKPDLSEEVFKAFTSDTNEGPFLRTGDLGFMANNELYVTGRLKDLIIIRGTNHYPQDIEMTVENSNKLLRPSSVAAFSVDFNNEEQLVIVQEARSKPNIDWSLVINDIRKEISEVHYIQPHTIVLIKPKTIFKTSSGKIRRNDTKKAFLNKSLAVIYEWNIDQQNDGKDEKTIQQPESNKTVLNSIQRKVSKESLVELLKKRLAEELKIDSSNIQIDEPFVNYGLDSAKSVQLVGLLEEKIGKELEPTILWTYPTIDKLADYLAGNNSLALDERKIEKENFSKKDFKESVNKMSEEEAEKLLMKKLGMK